MNSGEVVTSPAASFFVQLLPLLIVTIPLGFVINKLAKQKGRDTTAATVFAFVPFVNFYLMVYFVGATSLLTDSNPD